MYLRRESGSKRQIYPAIFHIRMPESATQALAFGYFFGSILEVVGFEISPKGNSQNADHSAMLISSLRIKNLSQG